MPTDAVLVVNSGSSSIKFAVFANETRLLAGQIAAIGGAPSFSASDNEGRPLILENGVLTETEDHAGALSVLLDWLQGDDLGVRIAAAGHRVVHGGAKFTVPVRIGPEVIAELKDLIPLAPHHQPHNLAAIEALADRLPGLEQVACFDTAFHSGKPAAARQLGLPAAYAERGMRRYGFHGLSYEYVVGALPRISGSILPGRLVIAHLGNGASMCAVRDGIGIATTMGFSTLDGLPMGSRSGALDPGAILHLMRREGLDLDALEDLLYNRCGLLGVSGISSDMRVLLGSAEPAAAEAVEFYCYRVARELGSLAAALGGIDALVFTGGIGENAAAVRANIIERSRWLGLALDRAANDGNAARITRTDGGADAWIVPTDEESVIARHTLDILGGYTGRRR